MIQEVKATDSKKQQTASLEQPADKCSLSLQLGSRRRGKASKPADSPDLLLQEQAAWLVPASLQGW